VNGWASSNRRTELPPNWHKLRAVILRRDGHRCTHHDNGRRCEAKATDVDHIGDRHNHQPDNLTSLCHPHHATKTLREAAAGRAARSNRRPEQRHPGLRKP